MYYFVLRWNKSGKVLATASDVLRLLSKTGDIIYSGSSEDLLWGIDCNHQDKAILTSSKEGKITFWTEKAKLIKRFER
jgi:hypothetical protein